MRLLLATATTAVLLAGVPAGSAHASCTVNVGRCSNGDCWVNVGTCAEGGACPISVGRCDDGETDLVAL